MPDAIAEATCRHSITREKKLTSKCQSISLVGWLRSILLLAAAAASDHYFVSFLTN